MDFFYTSTAGAVDFVALLLVCAAALYRGNFEVRVCGAVMLLAFLSKRAGLLIENHAIMVAILSSIDVALMSAVLFETSSRNARVFAALFFIEIVNYLALATNGIGWRGFVTGATVVVYLQLALLLSGATGNGLHDNGGGCGRLRPRYRRVADIARWV